MTRSATMLVAILITITIGSLLFAFDQMAIAKRQTQLAIEQTKIAEKQKQIADSAAYQVNIQSMKAKDLQKSYDSLLRVCK